MLSLLRAITRTMEQVILRAVAWSCVASCDEINNRAIAAQQRTTLASIAQHSHTDARCVARFIRIHCTTVAFKRTRLCVFRTSTFSYAIILATLGE